jgi:hypothetical protein
LGVHDILKFGGIEQGLASGKQLLQISYEMYLPRHGTFNFEQVSLKNNGQRILGITGFFTTFACTVVLLRIYVRIAILKSVGIDDFAMIIAAVSINHILRSQLPC